ncbi:ParB/RepB/Spo0J family partition protein [Singulisphaera sp. PoT]|uniref:ParB/RepB/Spo0J family partition protein n=1 Tax=Singulisphaera sp. PoT TaxID=3411797 RepID=UPI003BF59483
MGKAEELRRMMGANIAESSSRRDVTPAPVLSPALAPRNDGAQRSKNAFEIPIDRIERDPTQPREEFDEVALSRLAASLKERGQLQPVRVRLDQARGVYVLICGERRWRAAKLAGMPTLSCVVAEAPESPEELLALQLIENALREDLKPIEQAKAFRTLMDRNAWSGSRLAQEIGIDQSAVSHALRLLELPAEVQSKVEEGVLPPSTAYEISKVPDPEVQRDLADQVVSRNLSRAETAEQVRRVALKTKPQAKGARGGKPKLLKPRTVRLAGGGKVTLEPSKKATEYDVFLEMARELLAILEAEQGSVGEAA